MSDRLKVAFDEASRLPEGLQDAFAEFLLAELRDQRNWDQKFATSQSALSTLAAEARRERAEGRTKPLDDLLR
jgi:hypothetical protein